MENAAVDQPEVSACVPRLNVFRGLRAALLFGIVGAAAVTFAAFAFKSGLWLICETNAWDRSCDLQELPSIFASPLFGVSLLLAATGWATYAPRGQYRFTTTLVILAVVSVALWISIVVVAGPMDPLFRDVETRSSLQVLFEVVLFFAAPLVAGLVLSIVRCVRFVPPDAQTPPSAAS